MFLVNNLFSILVFAKEKRKEVSESSGITTAIKKPLRGPTKFQKIMSLLEKLDTRLGSEQDLFCETIAIALGLGVQDMAEFQSSYDSEKAAQSRLLKAKFAVSKCAPRGFKRI